MNRWEVLSKLERKKLRRIQPTIEIIVHVFIDKDED